MRISDWSSDVCSSDLEEHVVDVASYWSLGSAPPLRSIGGQRALVLATIEGEEDAVDERIAELAPAYAGEVDGLTVGVGGFAEVFRQVGTTIEEDLVKAEMIALPITLVLLLLVFGSVVSSSLPLAIGALSIVGTMAVLRLMAMVTEVSIFSLNLTTATMWRSEEHTSELQSLMRISYAVFCLKKKKTHNTT